MPLPPLLLERLKRRKIIRELAIEKSDSENTGEFSSEARYGDSGAVETEILPDQEQEEIIAEDYSDEVDEPVRSESEKSTSKNNSDTEESDIESKNTSLPSREQNDETSRIVSAESILGCPNKYNIYHECGQYCIDNYSDIKDIHPTMEQRKQLALILRTYPMSNEWTVVYDPGVRTFYFWNIISNLVSWFPPDMNGFVSMSANQIRRSLNDMELSTLD